MAEIPPWAGLSLAALAGLWWWLTPAIVSGMLWWVRQDKNVGLAARLTKAFRVGIVVIGVLGLVSSLVSVVWRLLAL
jgi:hypothetical protein